VNVAEYVRRGAARHPNRPAVIEGGRAVSYAELDHHADAAATWMLEQGLRPGDRVGVLADNSTYVAEAFYATARAGLTWVPINFRAAPDEVGDLLAHSGARLLLTADRFSATVDKVRGNLDLVAVVNHGTRGGPGTVPWSQVRDHPVSGAPRVEVGHRDRLCILYTSGTTGRAKGVVLLHAHAINHAAMVLRHFGLGAGSRFLSSYPHNSAATINLAFVPVSAAGAAVVIDEVVNFSAARFFKRVEADRVTTAQLVPTMLFRLLEHPDACRHDLSTLTTLGYGSAAIPAHRVAQLLERFGPILQQGYGMTETTSLATVLSKEDHLVGGPGGTDRLASCGRALEAIDVRVVDDGGRPVAAGELGEVAFSGPYVTEGYWRDESRSAEAIRDGWLLSGDVGRMDPEGYLTIVDRKKDLIISGGANIASTEVETALDAHPGVAEAVAVGVPDDHWGERVHCVVVLAEGAGAEPHELLAWARGRLAGYKAPKTVDIVDELPHNATGKVVKGAVRDWYR
jgi:acyl-CoA synthetase (AMP-forming)/AMP-acid ligase II